MRYLIVLLLAGCATVYEGSGNKFTVEHYRMNFGAAMDAAREHCAKKGMGVEHVATDRSQPGQNLSRFECVTK